ncbi:ABC transporter ATP-binding protein [Plantactinospora endophytica]|uniref:ABC transporter ATP-binding protein n=2 Tax=Plantactinospora endophytica TaxID=673535 RepID=A0ABQ4DTM0_9ACTN|nr:ABC transporter ATP-binding protein [Plantactinospora endophytica]GIG85792.1 ABC transporter ATP-binding protein [Plantactinospora endophytica]
MAPDRDDEPTVRGRPGFRLPVRRLSAKLRAHRPGLLSPGEDSRTGDRPTRCRLARPANPLPRNLWRLRHYLRPYRAQLVWLMLAAFAATGAGIAVPLVVQRAVDGPIAHRDSGGLLRLGGLALVLGLAEAGLIFIRRWAQSSSAVGMEATIRDDIYAHLQRLHIGFHDRWQSGQLLSRVTSDLSVIRRFLSFGLLFLVVNVTTYVAVVTLLITLHPGLGLLVAAGAVPLFLASRRFTRAYLLAARRLQDEQGDLATLIEESAQGIRTVKAFGRRPEMTSRFAAGSRTLHDTATGKGRLLARTSAQFDLIPNLTLAAVLVAGAVAVAHGSLTIGGLVAFVSLQLMLIWPIESLAWIIATAQEAMTAADRIYEVLDTRPTVVDRPGAVALPRVEGAGRGGELRFDGVWFGYPQGPPVLRGVDLTVQPGETLAVVGTTGCGKTTLLSLVPRLYDVTAGRITLDGQDIQDVRLDSLRSRVGVAFEEPTLFSMSVRENLTLGRADAGEEEVRAALAVAQADFVYDLPWGLDTRIGEQGLSLSGGQRQRLALARAILGRPGVLVLDDPLSALDVHTEALVERALARVLRDTTALVVVHRPSTVALADRVALLADGRIVAVGTHAELLREVPAYRSVLSAEDTDDLGLVRS